MAKKQCVADIPHMVEQWDFEKNTRDINQVSVWDRNKAHWKCKKCTCEWEASPQTRFRSTGKCPCCEMNRVIMIGVNDLFTVHQEACDTYDFEKNEAEGIDVYKLAPESNTSVHWKCDKCGHPWKASLKSRVKSKFRCPCCESGKAIEPNVNDILTLIPGLKDEYDYEKNKDIDIEHQGVNSLTVVWWRCKICGREWPTKLIARVIKDGENYTYYPCPHYNTTQRTLEEVPMVAEVPWLIEFWDFEKNTMDPEETKSNLEESAHWVCRECGHHWEAEILTRYRSLGLCPKCMKTTSQSERAAHTKNLYKDVTQCLGEKGMKAARFTSPYSHSSRGRVYRRPLCKETSPNSKDNILSIQYPELLEEWDYVNNYIIATPDNITDNSDTEVWWICSKNPNHSYTMSPKNRVMYHNRQKEACTYCKGLRRKKRHFI